MRITKGQLRRVIKEEARRLLEAEVDPEWEELVGRIAGAAAEEFKEANQYDPDMADAGSGGNPLEGEEASMNESAWTQQVEAAAQELTNELYELIAPAVQDVQTRLDQGEFWKG